MEKMIPMIIQKAIGTACLFLFVFLMVHFAHGTLAAGTHIAVAFALPPTGAYFMLTKEELF